MKSGSWNWRGEEDPEGLVIQDTSGRDLYRQSSWPVAELEEVDHNDQFHAAVETMGRKHTVIRRVAFILVCLGYILMNEKKENNEYSDTINYEETKHLQISR